VRVLEKRGRRRDPCFVDSDPRDFSVFLSLAFRSATSVCQAEEAFSAWVSAPDVGLAVLLGDWLAWELVSGAPVGQPAWLLALASAQEWARVPVLVVGDWAVPRVPAAVWPQQVARELLQR
jgi:hypothetical protein